jgi:murein L,D-transpeptidase YafK
LGTYWIGYPRHSQQFGIFIPVGYPNMSNIASGFTGNSIGIHGPMRFLTCLPRKSLEKNWTAGCFAVGRDTQIIAISEWIFAHWPVKLTISQK